MRFTLPSDMQKQAKAWLSEGKTIGFVPTMGALHEGHLSLVSRAKAENDITAVSIFVNPTQFGPTEDYQRYPRTLEKDLELLKSLHVDAVFHPEARDMFPPDSQTRVRVEKITEPLYGKVRPHFFGGVALVVLKLFNLVLPTRAYFGEKDYQQFLVIRQMVKDLNLDIQIIPCPIVREPDGLAMSSRNTYLNPEERKNAPRLYAALKLGENAIRNGEKNPTIVTELIEKKIREIPNVEIDYVALTDAETLQPISKIEGRVFLGFSVRLGQTRLLDNLILDLKRDGSI